MIVTNGITTNALLTADPELSRVYFEGIEDRLSLSEPNRRRFDSMIGLIIASFANECFLWLEDAVSPRVWSNRRRNMLYVFNSGGFQQWWGE
jgi:hypothetical protein